MRNNIIIFLTIIVLLGTESLSAQIDQISFDRVDRMPDQPAPYLLRDWKQVAQQYDAFIYDINKTGEFLPLVFIDDAGVNYPENPSFGLKTYVGSFNQTTGEAINILPSLVGATLVGIDKSNQDGKNWILYSQDFFNHKNGENMYLNNVGAKSGSDWWYDMIPNVYFYQLYDLYGNIGQATFQFNSVAERMHNAVGQMGGSDTPWQRPNMNYRAWDFVNAEPLASGVIEPEAAGAFGWLLYHAYKETGDEKYLKSAEWSMEFLSNLGTNPSYELQLPYGAYVAAKMNAEVGTNYDIEKLLFWIFNRGPLRGWGTIIGNWGGLDVSGLVGEANDTGNDYAFQLNGLQQAAALVPLVRYDKRFAGSVAKWLLNVASASRFMYPGFLPPNMQDASDWSETYDPQGVIGYEAMREKLNGLSPVATGDAFKSQWAGTNLSLYSSSSIGYLGSLITPTNVDQILLLDLLKTDFFGDEAYPSFLLSNPFSDQQNIVLALGEEAVDVYDAISETFILENVQGEVNVVIEAGTVMSLVYVPVGGIIETKDNQLLWDGVTIDYHQTKVPYDRPPRIQSFATDRPEAELGDTIQLYTKAMDLETKDLIYQYEVGEGMVLGEGADRSWILPGEPGIYNVMVTVEDGEGQKDTAVLEVQVVAEVNLAPQIMDLLSESLYTKPGQTVELTCLAVDLNNDDLTYTWENSGGSIMGEGNIVEWTSPDVDAITSIRVKVSDDKGGMAEETISLLTLDYVQPATSHLIAHYPFEGDADDISGNNLHGVISGAKFTATYDPYDSGVYFFDGVNDHISVANTDVLNFQQGISISLWMTPLKLPARESFIISHGSWENRWKLSIIPENNLRWTLKTTDGQVRDLDSQTKLEVDSTYHITTTYDGRFLAVFIDGHLESFSEWTGEINTTDIDLEIGQILPDNTDFNFGGVIDDIRIFDYALSPDTIAQTFGDLVTASRDFFRSNAEVHLFPNPVKDSFSIGLDVDPDNSYSLRIFDQLGKVVYESEAEKLTGVPINVQEYERGIYFIAVYTENALWTKKFLKI